MERLPIRGTCYPGSFCQDMTKMLSRFAKMSISESQRKPSMTLERQCSAISRPFMRLGTFIMTWNLITWWLATSNKFSSLRRARVFSKPAHSTWSTLGWLQNFSTKMASISPRVAWASSMATCSSRATTRWILVQPAEKMTWSPSTTF